MQLDRRGLRREIARGGHQRFAGHAPSGSTIRCCTTGCTTSARSTKSSASSAPSARSSSDPATAFREIDRVLAAAVRYRRPVYIELPRDMVGVVPPDPYTISFRNRQERCRPLREAVAEATRRIASAQRPVIIAGVEIHRFGLQDQLLGFAEGAGIPIATTMLGKSVIGETHPLFAGIYEGAMGHEEVTQLVEQSDCVILLGAFMTDINLGIYTANLDPGRCIYATSESLRISHHHFQDVLLADFIRRAGRRRDQGPAGHAAAAPAARPGAVRASRRRPDHRPAADRAAEPGAGRSLGGDRRSRATPCLRPANWSSTSGPNSSARPITPRWGLPCRRPWA